jgi:hypothetical protein
MIRLGPSMAPNQKSSQNFPAPLPSTEGTGKRLGKKTPYSDRFRKSGFPIVLASKVVYKHHTCSARQLKAASKGCMSWLPNGTASSALHLGFLQAPALPASPTCLRQLLPEHAGYADPAAPFAELASRVEQRTQPCAVQVRDRENHN